LTPESARLRARLAALTRHQGAGSDTEEIARDLRASRAEEYLTALISESPSLTADQRNRLALVLLGGGAA
jgi:hypothetical protein